MSKVGSFLKSKKARPFLIGGAVLVGGFLLFMMLRGGSGGSASAGAGSSGPSEALQAAQLQAQTQLGLAQLQANAQASQTAAELQAFMYGRDADVEIATRTLDSQTAIQMAGISAQQSIALSQEQTAQYGIQAQAAVSMAGIDAQAAMTQSQFAFLTSQEQSRERVELARINAQASTAKKQSNNNLIGGIIGGVLSFFSDERMKKGITWTGIETRSVPGRPGVDELNRYAYDYKWWTGIPGNHSGYIAQEVGYRNQASVSRSNRFLTVDYDTV